MTKCKQCGKDTTNLKFCSRSCSATHNNIHNPKRKPEGKCRNCDKSIKSRKKYCSKKCSKLFKDKEYLKIVEKICTTCKIKKSINNFNKVNTNSLRHASTCKECLRIKNLKRRIDLKIKAISYLGDGCQDCNLKSEDTYIEVFDFHHLDPSTKEYDWKKMRQLSWLNITKELDKCVCLCANCHRIRHAKEKE